MPITPYNRGKDAIPQKTVENIRAALKSIGISCSHQMFDAQLEGCYSCRVTASGGLSDIISANGKGSAADFSLASGYAELTERIQNKMFRYGINPYDPISYNPFFQTEKNYFRLIDEKTYLEDEDSYFSHVLEAYARTVTKTPSGWDKKQTALAQLRMSAPLWKNNMLLSSPYYDIQKKTYVWMPELLIKMFCGSNGMAAGNTVEEAIVQAYSEIFERMSQRRIIEEQLTPPSLPKEVYEQYEYIRKIVKRIESSGPYRVLIRDCSLGKGLPVVCGIIINTKHMTFGVRFGSHPNLGIALERVFTESMQGKDLESFTRYSKISFHQTEAANQQNIFNNLKIGTGYYPASILGENPSYDFRPWAWDEETDNKELVIQMTEKFRQEGHRVFIKNVSFLGFPSVHVLVEDASEFFSFDMLHLKEQYLKKLSLHALLNINRAEAKDVQRVIRICKLYRNSVLENNISSLYGLPFGRNFHGDGDQLGFLLAVCQYRLGNYQEAADSMKSCLAHVGSESPDYPYILAAYHVLSGHANGIAKELLKDSLYALADCEVCKQVLYDFEDPHLVLQRLYPTCNDFDCASCPHKDCLYPQLRIFYSKLYDAHNKSGFQLNTLHTIFEGSG